jgi:hypothetical protein
LFAAVDDLALHRAARRGARCAVPAPRYTHSVNSPPTPASAGQGPYRPAPLDRSEGWIRAARGLRLAATTMVVRFVLATIVATLQSVGFVLLVVLRGNFALARRFYIVGSAFWLANGLALAPLVLGLHRLGAVPPPARVRTPARLAAWLYAFVAVGSYAADTILQVLRFRGPMTPQRVGLLFRVEFAKGLGFAALNLIALAALLVALSRARRAAGSALPWWAWGLLPFQVLATIAGYATSILLGRVVLMRPALQCFRVVPSVTFGLVSMVALVALLRSTRRLILRVHE